MAFATRQWYKYDAHKGDVNRIAAAAAAADIYVFPTVSI